MYHLTNESQEVTTQRIATVTQIRPVYKESNDPGHLINDTQVIKHLDRMAQLDARIAAINVLINEIPQVKAFIEEINDLNDKRSMSAKRVEEYIKTITKGSIKGEYLQAVYSKGRSSWDTKSIEGYAASHPELLQFKKTGAPTVSFRSVMVAKKA